MKTISRKNILALMAFAFCVILASLLMTGRAAADYWMSGEVLAWAMPTPSSERYIPATPTTSLQDDMVANGGAGNRGEGHYYGNMATGLLSASAYAYDGYYPLYDLSGNLLGYGDDYAQGRAYVGMHDTLHFTVPSGVYTTNLVVTLSGVITGTITTTQHGQAGGSASAQLSGAGAPVVAGGEAREGETILVNRPFALSTTILYAGTYYTDYVTDVIVDLTIGGPGLLQASATISNPNPFDITVSRASLDFSHTLQITAMDVPPGVTWYSDSGVFLSKLPTQGMFYVIPSRRGGGAVIYLK
jgi:hypothetical protein